MASAAVLQVQALTKGLATSGVEIGGNLKVVAQVQDLSKRLSTLGVQRQGNWNGASAFKGGSEILGIQIKSSTHRLSEALIHRRRENLRPWVCCVTGDGGIATEDDRHQERRVIRRKTVAVFWDLDNKPPNSVPPYDAAMRLKTLASELGNVVDMVAYANKNAFTHVPARVREERQDRKLLDQLERRGLVEAEQPYVCSMCGRRCKTNFALKKHFRQLHERERQKRMNFLSTLKGKKRLKFLDKVADKEVKYKEAARGVIVPKVGYGLATELKRAGVHVRTVESKPQAADEALVKHMNLYINRGLDCICLVSDDSDFLGILKYARSKRVFILTVGDTQTLRRAADTSFFWEDVASGRAQVTARDSMRRWTAEDALRAELLEQFEDEESRDYFSESEDGYFEEEVENDDYYSDEDDEEEYEEFHEEEDYTRNFSMSQSDLP